MTNDSAILTAPERELLERMLDVQRTEIAALLDGLDDEQARRRLVASQTTVLGLVKHAAFVDRVWMQHRVGGRSRAEVGIGESAEDSFLLDPSDTVASVADDYRRACERSRVSAAGHELDEQYPWHSGPVSLRFVYAHMIAELARHAGHGDILREQLLG